MVQVLSVARRVKETCPETAPPRVKTQMARSGVFNTAWARPKRVSVRNKGVNIVWSVMVAILRQKCEHVILRDFSFN